MTLDLTFLQRLLTLVEDAQVSRATRSQQL